MLHQKRHPWTPLVIRCPATDVRPWTPDLSSQKSWICPEPDSKDRANHLNASPFRLPQFLYPNYLPRLIPQADQERRPPGRQSRQTLPLPRTYEVLSHGFVTPTRFYSRQNGALSQTQARQHIKGKAGRNLTRSLSTTARRPESCETNRCSRRKRSATLTMSGVVASSGRRNTTIPG